MLPGETLTMGDLLEYPPRLRAETLERYWMRLDELRAEKRREAAAPLKLPKRPPVPRATSNDGAA